ncbi:4-coumarate--CoA ligase-like 9 [Silene latifolia]|uniref:4-coumarate--CoA ligase-like 9 n=1 Tax=Silene latifolia TaxID=37657 RepID=UPI003D780E6B
MSSESAIAIIDPKSGYCATTQTYHSLRTPVPLPDPTTPLSISDYVLSVLHVSQHFSLSSPLLIDATSSSSLSYSSFLRHVDSLTSSLPPIPARRVALIVSPSSFHVPVLYFSLLSLNVVVSPANPLSTPDELQHIVSLSNPAVIFTVTALLPKLPPAVSATVILLDSPEFHSMLNRPSQLNPCSRVATSQDDSAVVLYSSGTTGRVKGVELTHRNLIALISVYYHNYQEKDEEDRLTRPISLVPLPLFHVFGFTMLLRAVTLSETLVMMERFDFEKMLAAVEKYKVTSMPVSPPLIVAFEKSELVKKYDISSLKLLGCGGAPLGKEVALRFKARFPDVEIVQGYGLTESGGGIASTVGPDECERYGSVGRLQELTLAKIVDPSTGKGLPPGKEGELWLHGPTIMKGYVGNKEATAETLLPEGWLRTGDLCYFDSDGFLYIVDRLKELIKYKGYQVPPAELEHLLLSHPDIADAAVVPYPDEEAGEIPMAFVVRKPGSNIAGAQVMDYVAKQVTPYKKIRRVSFISAIPKNPSGKILRRELVNKATGGPSKL